MGGFQDLKQAVDPSAALAPLTPEDVAFSDEQLADANALGLVLQDIGYAEKYVTSKSRSQEWDQIDNVYRAHVEPKTWPGSNEYRAHLSMPLVLEVLESILPQIHLAFFSDKTPFTLTAKGTTPQSAARASGKVLQWGIKQAGFKEEIRKVLKSCLQYGTGVGKWGWCYDNDLVKKYSRHENGKIISTTEEVDRSRPTFEFVELRNVLVDASLRSHNIRDAKFVILQKFITANELDEMREDDLYKNIPSREQLREILANKGEAAIDSMAGTKVDSYRDLQAEKQDRETSADPLQQPLELLEYWSQDRVIVVLQRKIVLRNDDNEYDRIPFVSCAFIDILGAFYGLGIGTLLKGEQALETGVANLWLDSLNLTLNPSFHRKKGTGPSSQNIKTSPGKVINDDGELAPLQVQSVTAEALQAIQSSESRARRRVGGNFGPDMPTQAMRTAEGVNEFTAGIQVRVQYFVELFADFVFIPTLEAFIEMSKDNLTPEQIDSILSDDEGKAFEDDHLTIYNGKYCLEVLSSTKLAAKRAMVSLVPTLMQLFSAAPVQAAMVAQNKKLDMVEFMNQVVDLSGWDAPGLIAEMTPEELQRSMMMNPAVQRTQGDLQVQAAKHQNDLELESAKGDVRGGIQVIKHVLDSSGKHDDSQNAIDAHMPEAKSNTVPSFWPYGGDAPESSGQPAQPLATRV